MERHPQTHRLTWQGIALSITYEPGWLGMSIAHLEVRAERPERAPLPITETGYRSHFIDPRHIEAAGGPEAFVTAWLDVEAQTPAWQRHLDQSRQGSLF